MSHVLAQTQNYFDEDHRQMFLDKHGWSIERPVGQDSSIRRYFRVVKGDKAAILMETVPDSSAHATPGHSLAAFVSIAGWLNEIGVNAPDIYEVDEEQGYVLLEDFGDTCFKYALLKDHDAAALYTLAAQTLEHIEGHHCPLDLPAYYDSHVHRRHRRVIDWYVPLIKREKNTDGLVEQYRAIWGEIENHLPPCPQGFVHVDFHGENLMLLPGETGIRQCGILDFQGAMIGPLPYDLANLLEDARTDVPAQVKAKILAGKDETFLSWYRVLATQFHCRVIGQFIKQAVTDENTRYLKHIPRLESYIREGLKDPLLKPLAEFFENLDVRFDHGIPEDLNNLSALIAEDAF